MSDFQNHIVVRCVGGQCDGLTVSVPLQTKYIEVVEPFSRDRDSYELVTVDGIEHLAVRR